MRNVSWWLLDCLWHGHEWHFKRNLYGDEIHQHSTLRTVARSEWVCAGCGAMQYRSELHRPIHDRRTGERRRPPVKPR